MPRDFRECFDTKFLRAWNLQGDTPVTITKIESGMVGWGKKAVRKPIFYFLELNKPLAMNTVNASIIGQVCGTFDPDELLGKQVVLYATTTDMQGEIVDCIRIRPKGYVPRGTPARNSQPVHNHNQPRQQQQPVAPARSNGHPPIVTQADQLLADEKFMKELDAELHDRGFDERQREVFTSELCRTMNINDVYDLDASMRGDLLRKLKGGRYDRFKAPISSVSRVA